jgi:hypothetical protein
MIVTSIEVGNVSSQTPYLPRRRRNEGRRPRIDVLARVAVVVAGLVLIAVLQTLLFLGLS